MGKPTGFLEIERHDRTYDKVGARLKTWKEFVQPLPLPEVGRAGRALHGLRHPVLPPGLPGQQPDPGLQQPGLPRPVEGGAGEPAVDQQLPGVHRPRLPRALRGVLHAEHRRQPGDHQDDRVPDRRPRLGRGLDRARRCRRAAPASASRWWARAPRAWPAPSSWPAPAMRRPSSRSPTGSAACSATASPTSRWKSTSSTGASGRWRPRA